MPDNSTTTKFKVDISELKKAMQEAKRSIAVTNSEFKEAASSMDDWSKSTDGISAKLKQLDSNLKNQKSILGSLEKQYELTVKEMGEGSKAADDLKIKINNQKATINQTEREISKFESSLNEVAEAEKKASKTGKDVSDVLDEMHKEAEEAGDGFTTFKGAIATFAGNMLTGFVGAIKDGISNIVNLANETREYRNELAKLDTAFTTSGLSSEDATKTYKDLYAVLGDEGQATEAASFLAKICDNEKELTDWTKIATGVYATFGASLPVEGLTEAANETAKVGQVTGPLADALNWAGVSEDKFNESLEKCSNEQERQQLITETLNGLYSEAATKYEETNKSVMDANRANSDYMDTMSNLGAKIEPITTKLKEGFNNLLQKILEMVDGVDFSAFTSKIDEAFKVLTDKVLPAVKDGFQWILDNKDMLIAGLAGIAAGFVAFNVANMIMGVVNAFKAFKTANEGATVAQWLMNAAMNANPIVLIVTLIAGLVAAIVVLWNKCDGFRNFFTGLWEGIKNVVGTVVNAIGGFFSGLWDGIKNIFGGIGNWFKDKFTESKEKSAQAWDKAGEIWSGIKDKVTGAFSAVGGWFKDKFNEAKENSVKAWEKTKEVWSGIKDKVTGAFSSVGNWFKEKFAEAKENSVNAWSTAKENFSKVKDKVTGAFGDLGSKMKGIFSDALTKAKEGFNKIKDIGSDLLKGLWNGISSAKDWLYDKISGLVDSVTGWIKDLFGIKSPSKVMAEEVGRWLPEGIAVGIDKNAKSVLQSMRSLANATVGVARDGLTGGVSGFGGGVVNNYYQTINSPKQLDRLTIYRNTKNLLGFAGR